MLLIRDVTRYIERTHAKAPALPACSSDDQTHADEKTDFATDSDPVVAFALEYLKQQEIADSFDADFTDDVTSCSARNDEDEETDNFVDEKQEDAYHVEKLKQVLREFERMVSVSRVFVDFLMKFKYLLCDWSDC